MKNYLREIVIGIVICGIVIFGWRFIEVLLTGEARASVVDGVIALVLITSLYMNTLFFRRIYKRKS